MSGSDNQQNTPAVPAFNVGDEVIYTNPQGVCFGKRIVTGRELSFHADEAARGVMRYHISPTDTPWFPVAESCLKSL